MSAVSYNGLWSSLIVPEWLMGKYKMGLYCSLWCLHWNKLRQCLHRWRATCLHAGFGEFVVGWLPPLFLQLGSGRKPTGLVAEERTQNQTTRINSRTSSWSGYLFFINSTFHNNSPCLFICMALNNSNSNLKYFTHFTLYCILCSSQALF